MFSNRLIPFVLLAASCALNGAKVSAAPPDKATLDALAAGAATDSFSLLRDILSVPNDAQIPAHMEPNLRWCEDAFGSRGFEMQRLATPTVPLLLAERPVDEDAPTVLVYLQIDGQPVDQPRWFQEDPYTPVLKERNEEGEWVQIPWSALENYDDDMRVFARAASDAKGPVAMFLAAWDVATPEGMLPDYNLKIIMDFEEELGSPQLPAAVEVHREALSADRLVIFDGPMHITNRPTLTFGARGIATLTLTTFGPVVPQHSGHFGNYAPNPALRLAQLLASMKDEEGRVVIEGFYDGIEIDDATDTLLRGVPDDEEEIRDRLQLGSVDAVGSYYQESIQYPSLNIRGMQSGWINDEVRTIIPAWARAEIDVRLVKESDPERLIQLIRNHVESQGFYIADGEPDKATRIEHAKVATLTHEISYQSFRTPLDSPMGLWLRSALTRAHEQDPVLLRMSGGSIPISPFVNTLGVPAVTVPTVNRDNNQHSPNENLRLGNYRDGIKTILAVLTEPF